jgi:transposase
MSFETHARLCSYASSINWGVYSAPDFPGQAFRLTRTGRPGGNDGEGTRQRRSADRREAPGETPERWSAARKTDVVLRLSKGEPIDAVSRDTQVPAHELEEWRRVFLASGKQGLKKRSDPEDRELRRVQAKLGEVMMRLELVEDLLENKGYATERFIRTPKEQCLWLHRFETLDDARAIIGAFIERYNHQWLIERLDHRTPAIAPHGLVVARLNQEISGHLADPAGPSPARVERQSVL